MTPLKIYTKSLTVILTVILTLIAVVTSSASYANECMKYIPSRAISVEGLKLCKSSYNGLSSLYSCQDYLAGDTTYRVLYKGGVLPKAILVLKKQQQEELIWSTIFGGRKLHCPLLAPKGIHIHATHHGTGICVNDNEQAVPCSVYEYKSSRQTESHRYLVLYSNNKTQAQSITVQTFIFDVTIDAMTAEIAYQFGLSLLDTLCCSEQAIQYLEYAYNLYPKANKYSTAYINAKFYLSAVKDSFRK